MTQTAAPARPLGFWSTWALSVGCMIGSGVFTLPAVLAPYGLMSFGGWLLSGAGSMALALVFARLASRTAESGGPYVYAREAFGDFTGFLIAWGYWVSYVVSIPAIAIAFAGYLPVFLPGLTQAHQALAAAAILWAITLVNLRGLKEAGLVQIAMTALKITPLVAVIGLGAIAGQDANLPPLDPTGAPPLATFGACAILALWAFTGFEAGVMPAGAVKDAERVIPRAIVWGMITVTVIYLASTWAVMRLVPADTLAQSTAPFADAARAFGPWGAGLIAFGALFATAGTLNGVILVCGQMPFSVAQDGLAPRVLARTNAGGAPHMGILISAVLGTLLLAINYTKGALAAFQFLVLMSTLTILLPYLVSALAELRHSWRSARGWAIVAILGGAYSVFAIAGSGAEVILWGAALLAAGAPAYFLHRRSAAKPLA